MTSTTFIATFMSLQHKRQEKEKTRKKKRNERWEEEDTWKKLIWVTVGPMLVEDVGTENFNFDLEWWGYVCVYISGFHDFPEREKVFKRSLLR